MSVWPKLRSVCVHTRTHAYTRIHTYTQTDRQTDGQTDRQTDRQTHVAHIYTHAHTHTCTRTHTRTCLCHATYESLANLRILANDVCVAVCCSVLQWVATP